MFRTILVPYDQGTLGDDILEFACSLADKTQGRVVVLVTPQQAGFHGGPYPSNMAWLRDDTIDRIRQAAQRVGGTIEIQIARPGAVARAIVQAAHDVEADAVFLALAPGNPWRRIRHGWVAWSVVRRAPCPVRLWYRPAMRIPSGSAPSSAALDGRRARDRAMTARQERACDDALSDNHRAPWQPYPDASPAS